MVRMVVRRVTTTGRSERQREGRRGRSCLGQALTANTSRPHSSSNSYLNIYLGLKDRYFQTPRSMRHEATTVPDLSATARALPRNVYVLGLGSDRARKICQRRVIPCGSWAFDIEMGAG